MEPHLSNRKNGKTAPPAPPRRGCCNRNARQEQFLFRGLVVCLDANQSSGIRRLYIRLVLNTYLEFVGARRAIKTGMIKEIMIMFYERPYASLKDEGLNARRHGGSPILLARHGYRKPRRQSVSSWL
jgi:hypothetical protein